MIKSDLNWSFFKTRRKTHSFPENMFLFTKLSHRVSWVVFKVLKVMVKFIFYFYLDCTKIPFFLSSFFSTYFFRFKLIFSCYFFPFFIYWFHYFSFLIFWLSIYLSFNFLFIFPSISIYLYFYLPVYQSISDVCIYVWYVCL